MGRKSEFRLSRRPGKRRKLRAAIADHYEEALRALLGGVRSEASVVETPAGVVVSGGRGAGPAKRSFADRRRDELASVHASELLEAAAGYFRSQNEVAVCVRCRKKQVAVVGAAARLHRVLTKIMGDQAPPHRPTAI